MAIGFNRVILMGNLTRDPETRYARDGSPVTTFGLAVNRPAPREGGQETGGVDFFDIVTFRKTAETVSTYLKKGRPVLVEGRLQLREYTTAEGEKRRKTEVVASTVRFLGPRPEPEGEAAPPAEAEGPPEDDIPF